MAWLLQIYDIPLSRVEAIERLTAMPQCFSSGRFYSAGTKLQLLSSPVEEYKITKVRQYLTLRDNKDEKVRRDRAYLEADMGWFVKKTVLEEAELRLKKADIVGNVKVGRLGRLETVTSTRVGTAGIEVLKKLLLKKVRVIEEDPIMEKAVGMKKQENDEMDSSKAAKNYL